MVHKSAAVKLPRHKKMQRNEPVVNPLVMEKARRIIDNGTYTKIKIVSPEEVLVT